MARAIRAFVLRLALRAAVGAAAAAACPARAADPPQRPNFLILVSDDQRPDTIGALGQPLLRTPHLDRLVAEGTTLTRAITAYPLCVPSRAELLTGRSSLALGFPDRTTRLPEGLAWFPEVFRRAGYRTGFVGKWHTPGTPHERGFERTEGWFQGGGREPTDPAVDYRGAPVTGYRGWQLRNDAGERLPALGTGLQPDTSATLADAALRLLDADDPRPLLLFVCFTAPHDPLLLPPGEAYRYDPATIPLPRNFLPIHPFDHGNLLGRDERLLPWPRTPALIRADLAAYYAVVSHLDAQVGRLLGRLAERGLDRSTFVIYTSDHGLALGSHGLRGKQNMYEHTVGIPLVVRGPGIPPGTRRGAACYLRDLLPTCCELASLPVPEGLDGRSQAAVLRGQAESVYREVVGYFADSQRMIRDGRWKLIRYPRTGHVQLFDLARDPEERENLAGDPAVAETRARLDASLSAALAALGEPPAAATQPAAATPTPPAPRP